MKSNPLTEMIKDSLDRLDEYPDHEVIIIWSNEHEWELAHTVRKILHLSHPLAKVTLRKI